MAMTYNDFLVLFPVNQLVGKTIQAIQTVPDGIPEENSPDGWIIKFTDGEQIELKAHYGDSEVFFVKVGT